MKLGNDVYVLFGILAIANCFNVCFTPSAQCQETQKAKTKASIKPLTKEQQEHLLKQRLSGGLENTFGQFTNKFLVMSRISLPYGVGLMSPSRAIAATELQPVYPQFYKPTLRELLDVIALQTKSLWKYDPTSKYFHSEVETGPVKDLAIFEFTETAREKPYQVKLPKGWRSVDKGQWTMYVPPVFPIGMDIYELGTYSSDDKDEANLLKFDFCRFSRRIFLSTAKHTGFSTNFFRFLSPAA